MTMAARDAREDRRRLLVMKSTCDSVRGQNGGGGERERERETFRERENLSRSSPSLCQWQLNEGLLKFLMTQK